MTKEKLLRLKAGLLAGMLCLTMGACKREEDGETKENVETKSAAVFFVQGKALIYEEDYLITIEDDCYSIGDEIIVDNKLTLDNVNVQANNYTSPYALIYVYNDSTLNIENNSSINAKNEKSLSGGVIKTSKGQAGKVNITNSTLNFENTARGFVDGTINMKSSEVSMKGLANGINSSNAGLNLTVDNSDLTITNSIGSALKIDNSEVNVVNDSKLDLNKSLAGDIQFASKGTVTVDKSSELNVDKIKLDNSIKDTDLDNLIVSERNDFDIDDKGNVIKVNIMDTHFFCRCLESTDRRNGDISV